MEYSVLQYVQQYHSYTVAINPLSLSWWTWATTAFNGRFLLNCLCFEVAFDFFHYWTHRWCHESSYLYRKLHRVHHTQVYPTPLSTFAQHPLDLVLTNAVPMLLAIQLCTPRMTVLQWHWLFAYKTYVEVAGHCGLVLKGHSFPQFPWLHYVLPGGFCLRIKDHDYHHTHPTHNFAKRFRLWDHVFGTYRNPKKLHL